MFKYIKETIIPDVIVFAVLFTLMLSVLLIGSEAFFGDLP